MKTLVLGLLVSLSAFARPASYTDLIQYVIQAPDQGSTGTGLYQASTGAMEVLLNQRFRYRDQNPGDWFDLSEQFLIFQPYAQHRGDKVVAEFHKFSAKQAIHANELPFSARSIWTRPAQFESIPRMEVPSIETRKLFLKGDGERATDVLNNDDIEKIKLALWEREAPVIVSVNENGEWHTLVIVGFDDDQSGSCHTSSRTECDANQDGAFYVRDSFGGPATQLRDTDWFRVKGNAAYQVMLRN